MFGKNFLNSKNESDRKKSPHPFQEEEEIEEIRPNKLGHFNFAEKEFSTKFPEPMNTKHNFFESNFEKEPINSEGKKFIEKYRDNIHKIFDECSERGEIEIPKLKSLLVEADVNKAFSILMKKLENLERDRHKKAGFGGSSKREDVLKYDDFERLFEFDLGKEDDFDILFDTIDELGNNSSSIGLAELEQANKHYDLGLSPEDMEIMLKYIGKDPNVVTKDELKTAMGIVSERKF